MKGFSKINHIETESIYSDVKRLVSSWADNKNPDLDVAPFGQTNSGIDHYSIPLVGTKSGFDDLSSMCKDLDSAFPDAKLAEEPLPDGTRRYYINVPLYIPNGKKRGGHYYSNAPSGKPSTEWLMFLVMIEAISGVILYFRI
jgi:hypothetical protein